VHLCTENAPPVRAGLRVWKDHKKSQLRAQDAPAAADDQWGPNT
jgi:hypothetical protein